MKRLTTFALAIASLFTVVAVAGAASGSESAQGGYELFGGQYDISFSAKATLQDTNASGHLKWINRSSDPDTILEADINCMILGPARTATVGGVVTSYSGPFSNPNVRSVYLTVKDNGQGPTALTSDLSSSPVLSANPSPQDVCALPFTPGQSPITSGDITVKPAL